MPAAAVQRREVAAAAVTDWRQWSQIRVESDGRAVVLARSQVPRLAQLLEDVVQSAQTHEPLAMAARTRIEVSHQGVLLGVLQVVGDQVRFVAPQAPGPARSGRPDPALLQALRQEMLLVLPR
jgi:hypothetical protein